jgi:DNA repair exonuclease SbcCD ATPase subunit
MAVKNSLADLNAASTGSRVHLSVQDEGFGTMDETNLDGAKAMIREIAHRRGGWYVFMSHLPGMEEVADTVIRVRDEGGLSTAEVER